jgi:hypothetical protein
MERRASTAASNGEGVFYRELRDVRSGGRSFLTTAECGSAEVVALIGVA